MTRHRSRALLSLSTLGVVFAAYLALGGLLWTRPVTQPSILVATLTLYVLVATLCIYWPGAPPPHADPAMTGFGAPTQLPRSVTLLAVSTAVITPSATWFAVDAPTRLESFATWSLGGIGALMAIVMVRHRPWSAWLGVAALTIQAFVWIGPEEALARGLVGAYVWVGAAQLLMLLLDRAMRDARRMNEVQRSAQAWIAQQDASGRERRVRVRRALSIAGPVLARAVESGGHLTDDERFEARLAEARLRDEIRGGGLLDDVVRGGIDAARGAGARVTVVDEGGLRGLTEDDLAAVREQISDALTGVASDQIIIRAAPHARIAVTVVGRSHGDDGEDVVDLWREIDRSTQPDPSSPAP